MENDIFKTLLETINSQQKIIDSIADKLSRIESLGGGGGTASIEDYESGKEYNRNVLVVDIDEETVYRVINKYTSVDIKSDKANGNLKLVGFESQVVNFDHDPTQKEIGVLPERSFAAVYNPTDAPYVPDLKE